MAYTQADLDNVRAVINGGASSTRIDGQEVTYRNLADLERIEARIMRELTPTKPRSRTRVAVYRRP